MTQKHRDVAKNLWKATRGLLENQSSEEYMFIVIGILFLKHISESFDFLIARYEDENNDQIDRSDKDDLALAGISFIIPPEAKWTNITKYAASPKIGEKIDQVFEIIEGANQELIGLFEKNYNREQLNQQKLGLLVSEFANIDLVTLQEGLIGEIYEYFLGNFFKEQGKRGEEFYTPKSIIRLMIDLLNPIKGKIYDPTLGIGSMLVEARNHLIKNKRNLDLLITYGQEIKERTLKLAKINLLLHGVPIDIVKFELKLGNTLLNDLHQNKYFDYILANPPFKREKWGGEAVLNEKDQRWEWGYPPQGNANYAWLSHMIHKLSSTGKGATVLANGSLSTVGKDELKIRQNFVKSNVIEAIITLPDKLFYTGGIPACIWVFNKNKKSDKILMINAADFTGEMLSKKLREITDQENKKIVDIYNKFASGKDIEEIGFAKSVDLKELIENDYSFAPGRYVGFVEAKIDKEEAKVEIKKAALELEKLFDEFQETIPKVKEAISKALHFDEHSK